MIYPLLIGILQMVLWAHSVQTRRPPGWQNLEIHFLFLNQPLSMRYWHNNDILWLTICSNDSEKHCSQAGKSLICFSSSLYLLQGSFLWSPGRKGSLGEWNDEQDWSQRLSFSLNTLLIPDYCQQKYLPKWVWGEGGSGGQGWQHANLRTTRF